MDGETAARVLRPVAAAAYIGISLPTLWRRVKADKEFPRPRRQSERCTIFLKDELDRYLEALPVAEEAA